MGLDNHDEGDLTSCYPWLVYLLFNGAPIAMKPAECW